MFAARMILPAPSPPPGGGYTPDPTKIIFLGDYSTGNFSQWPTVQNVIYNSSGSGYPATGNYQAAIENDATYGKAARFEVRDGDSPFLGTERSEVQAGTNTGGAGGDIRWYEFATKFDTTFPNLTTNWGLVNQWHGDDGTSSPPVAWNVDRNSGQWTLTINRQSSPGVFLSSDEPLSLSLNKGVWQHITMRIVWSTSDVTGSVQVWLNQVRQTFTDASQTYVARTLVGGGTGSYYKEGHYRDGANTATAIVWHTGFRACTDKTGLTWQVP